MFRSTPRNVRWPHAPKAAGGWLASLVALGVAACEDAPTGPEAITPGASDAVATVDGNLDARHGGDFAHWLQTFDHGTDGWYGEDQEGPLGWCGEISWHERGAGPVPPSRGSGYATVAQSGCNDFWGAAYPNLLGAPWAPGPDGSNFSTTWPHSGFVMELDIYLDPSWTSSAIPCEWPSEAPFFPPLEPCNYFAVNPGSVFTVAATLRETARPPGPEDVFVYFGVPVLPGDGTLSVLGHDVTRAGWYTFAWAFRDAGGDLKVTFELSERRGGVILTEAMDQSLYGVATSSLDPLDWGSGYLWFVRISPHLEIPIDHHHLRRGR